MREIESERERERESRNSKSRNSAHLGSIVGQVHRGEGRCCSSSPHCQRPTRPFGKSCKPNGRFGAVAPGNASPLYKNNPTHSMWELFPHVLGRGSLYRGEALLEITAKNRPFV